ncbi:MAG: methylenetetrahydrofolate reductase [NAD(P)H] [Verrucomicrobiota bacterium]
MHIHEILRAPGPKFSLEFFPPKNSTAEAALFRCVEELRACDPAFVSVTCGAGGSTRGTTGTIVDQLRKNNVVVPHLTCVGSSAAEIEGVLREYAAMGVANILALRGDPPKNGGGKLGDFPFAADLVKFIRVFSDRTGHHFGIGVAGFPEGHPATPNRLLELDHLKAKVDAGADYICTQLFFDNHDFHDFRGRCELAGIRVPILAGIFTITSFAGMARISDLAGGARIPARLLRAIQRVAGDDDTIRQIGIHHATSQVADLLDNDVDGVHFYTLNHSGPTLEIMKSLGLCREIREVA